MPLLYAPEYAVYCVPASSSKEKLVKENLM